MGEGRVGWKLVGSPKGWPGGGDDGSTAAGMCLMPRTVHLKVGKFCILYILSQ